MSENYESASRWHEAAALALFAFYEASNGSERWAGGFAGDGSLIEVIAVVDGDEVSVESSRPEGVAMRDVVRRRLTIADLLWRHVLRSDRALALPYSVTVEADDRPVTVDGELYTVPGMRIEGDPGWVGTMRLGDVTVKIATASPAALVLRACVDPSSLPEMPPGAR
jgi:hypothetical protein